MAPSEGDDLGSGSENPEINDINSDLKSSEVFKCCGKNTKILVCKICLAFFHASCATRANKIRKSEGKNVIVCVECKDRTPNSGENLYLEHQIDYLKNELALKNRIIKELEDKNSILIENSGILKENNGLLVEKIQRMLMEINVNIPNKKHEQQPLTIQQSGNSVDLPKYTVNSANRNQTNRNTHVAQRSYSELLKTTSSVPSDRNLRNCPSVASAVFDISDSDTNERGKTRETTTKYQNKNTDLRLSLPKIVVDKDNDYDQSVSNKTPLQPKESQSTFIYPRRNFKKRLGIASPAEEDKFVGEDRKVWLYVYRVKRECNAKEILDYIKNKDGFAGLQVGVKEIPSDENKPKCFMVSAPFSKKDQMYDPEFWPKYVGVKRFNFKRHRSFLDSIAGDFLSKT